MAKFRRDMDIALDYILFSILRFFQFVLALTVCGLYGVDLHNARSQGKYADGKWVFAEVVGGLSAVTALLYMVPFVMRLPFAFLWDLLLCFLWIVLFGIFGNMYIHANPQGDSGIQRMKNAVWVDLVNMLLWLISAVLMAGYWWRNRNSRSQFTGRAHV